MSDAEGKRLQASPFLYLGYAALVVLVLGLGTWSAMARISGAIVASGTIAVEGNRQVVQHPTGGVIEAIFVRDGNVVEEGDILIKLDGKSLISELGIVEGQWFEILARKSRISAERDGLAAVAFGPEVLERAEGDAVIRDLITAQEQQFEARRKTQADEASQLDERKVQIANQIDGLDAQQDATQSQIDLIAREIEGQEALLAQGLTQITRVLTPQRELARLRGSAGQTEASIAESRGRIAEIEIERVRLASKLREDAIAELRDLEYREIELRERRDALLEEISRLDLRAPVGGIVYGSTADTLRGVIRPAEPILYIVPQDSPLIVRSRIMGINIDQIHVGQPAVLRFSAFDMRTTPEVAGELIAVSADVFEDERTGASYYRADIRMAENAQSLLGSRTLLPGMPVEAFIRGEDRSPLNYLLKPFLDYFSRAFREA